MLFRSTDAKIVTFGISSDADVRAVNIVFTDLGSSFDVIAHGKTIGNINLTVSGMHNILDALAAITLAIKLDLPPDSIIGSLKGFNGTKRRFERLGSRNGAVIVDDYAHHPTEIQTTLDGARRSFPGRRIRAVFQPHTFSRTERLFYEFSESFQQADEVLLAEIFSSAREKKSDSNGAISSAKLADLIRERGISTKHFLNLEDISSYLNETLDKDDLVITLGAGDIYKVGHLLVSVS